MTNVRVLCVCDETVLDPLFATVSRPFRTVFRGLGAGFWNLGGQAEKMAKKRGKTGKKWARNGLKKAGPMTDSWQTHGSGWVQAAIDPEVPGVVAGRVPYAAGSVRERRGHGFRLDRDARVARLRSAVRPVLALNKRGQ